ncbi:GntR family transcriptional regulator [Paenibacillus sp. HJGM_3]|uniref:GntR family transcriptional regulator n=1 Tax=Paenibacillus sp. HJGM_3 TaxID=3379816 RepID=UPI00385B40F5
MEFHTREPVYTQIIEDFRIKIINGTYAPGQEIPSRRELAKQLGVNPNTIQRAYREMEDTHLVVTHRGQGSYVTSDWTVIEALRQEALDTAVRRSIELLRSFGQPDEKILKLIHTYMKQGEPQ